MCRNVEDVSVIVPPSSRAATRPAPRTVRPVAVVNEIEEFAPKTSTAVAILIEPVVLTTMVPLSFEVVKVLPTSAVRLFGPSP